MSITIFTQFYEDEIGKNSHYPQVGLNSSSIKFHEIYWKTLICMFSTARQHNPEHNLILVTNNINPVIKGGINVLDLLNNLNVKLIKEPFNYDPPDNFSLEWRSTFYKFDALRAVLRNLKPDDIVIQIDSDCIWRKPANDFLDRLDDFDIIGYSTNLDPLENINGLNRIQLTEFAKTLGYEGLSPILHYGGEFLCGKVIYLNKLLDEIDKIWRLTVFDFKKGKSTLKTEEHIISCICLLYTSPSPRD